MAKQLIVISGNAFPCPKCNSMLAPAIKVSYAKVHIIADHAIEQFSGSMGLVTLPRIELNGLIDEPKKRRTELMGFHT